MVYPVCGEPPELEGYEVGDLLDCEACGAVLPLLSDGSLEAVALRGGGGGPPLLQRDPGGGAGLQGGAFGGLEAAGGRGEEAPKEAEDELNLEPEYLAVHVETQGPPAPRRVVFPGAPDLLEFTLPSGSLYEFPFRQVLKMQRPILL